MADTPKKPSTGVLPPDKQPAAQENAAPTKQADAVTSAPADPEVSAEQEVLAIKAKMQKVRKTADVIASKADDAGQIGIVKLFDELHALFVTYKGDVTTFWQTAMLRKTEAAAQVGRDKSMLKIKLEEAVFWFNKHLGV